jgi:DNA-binding IclR family transcriptional regulator
MGRPLKITDNVVAIFNQMLHPLGKSWYGLELAEAAKIGSATIYAALTRMERAGLVRASWENHDPSELGRPQRRMYALTPAGIEVGRDALANYQPRVTIAPDRTGFLPGLATSEDAR